MNKDKKHTESSYQPVKQNLKKPVKGYPITSKEAEVIDEDNTNFDHKPSQSEIDKAVFINAKMQKMRKESQGRKAVKDSNKVINSIKNPIAKKSALNMLGISRKGSPAKHKAVEHQFVDPNKEQKRANHFKAYGKHGDSPAKMTSPLDCWKGYKRVAGTKEFSPGSCKKSN